MVLKKTPGGTPYLEPPYTPEEEADFYRRVGRGPVTVVRPAPRERPRKSPEPSPEE